MKILAIAFLLCLTQAKMFDERTGRVMNDRPIIGVFALPSEFPATHPTEEYNYIAASYVKWIEQAGARTMPVAYDMKEDDLRSLFSKINGILFPGGFWNIFIDQYNERNFTELAFGAKKILDVALQANYDGDYFPIYGIQSGMQLICALMASDGQTSDRLFYNFSMQNLANKLEYMRMAKDKMWASQDQETLNFTSIHKSQLFFSNFSLSVRNFLRSEKLRDMFDITSMSEDDNGQKFIASIQGKNLPIYGTQFFAQGNTFEWKNNLKLNHHPVQIDFTQQLANFFVDESRSNMHEYKIPDDQDELLMYNFPPSKIENLYFQQIIFFKKGELQKRLRNVNVKLQTLAQQESLNRTEVFE